MRAPVLSRFLLSACLLAAGSTQAQVFRAYLASDGSDTNPCTLPQPCRLLPAALTAVVAGGEVWMLDSANYNTGPVSITKSVTLFAIPGAVGSVLAISGNAINVATAGVKLTLRNLVIVPLPGAGGIDGVNMTAGSALTIDGCFIGNMPNSSLYVNAAANVVIVDSTMSGNGDLGVFLRGGARATVTRTRIIGNAHQGFEIWGSPSTTTTADISDSVIDGNEHGVFAYSTDVTAIVKIAVRNSQIARSSQYGAIAISDGGAPVTLVVSDSLVSNNNIGVSNYSAQSRVLISGSTVTGNSTGLYRFTGLLESAGNNVVHGNASNTAGGITTIGLQ